MVGHFVLVPLLVNRLLEVTLMADQRDRNQPELQIGARTHGIAGQNAESPAVGGDVRVQRYLHREIGDPRFFDKVVQIHLAMYLASFRLQARRGDPVLNRTVVQARAGSYIRWPTCAAAANW